MNLRGSSFSAHAGHDLPTRTAPTVGIFDAPTVGGIVGGLSVEWSAHILSALDALTDPETWAGDDATKRAAVAQVESYISQLFNGDT